MNDDLLKLIDRLIEVKIDISDSLKAYDHNRYLELVNTRLNPLYEEIDKILADIKKGSN